MRFATTGLISFSAAPLRIGFVVSGLAFALAWSLIVGAAVLDNVDVNGNIAGTGPGNPQP